MIRAKNRIRTIDRLYGPGDVFGLSAAEEERLVRLGAAEFVIDDPPAAPAPKPEPEVPVQPEEQTKAEATEPETQAEPEEPEKPPTGSRKKKKGKT